MSIQSVCELWQVRQRFESGVASGVQGWNGTEEAVRDGSARQAGARDQGNLVGPGQGFAGGAAGHGVGVGGESGSCGTPDSLWRSAEQKPGGGDALDEMHRCSAPGARPQWL
jgi:hypothetical protein